MNPPVSKYARALTNATVASLLLLSQSSCGDDPGEGGDGPARCGPGETMVRGECVPRDDGSDDATGGDVAGDAGHSDTTGGDTADRTDLFPLDNGGPETTTGDCTDGQIGCSPLGAPQHCSSGHWVDDAACGAMQVCVAGRCVDGADCTPGSVIGCASGTEQYACNEAGNNYEPRPCADGLFCFRGSCGTQICDPGARSCDEDGYTVTECGDSGEFWEAVEVCDRRDNRVCNLGECVSGCIAATKDPSYIGCEYWSIDLPQYEDPLTSPDPRVPPHAVVVANVGDRDAEISIESFDPAFTLMDPIFDVPAGEVQTIFFPNAQVENTSRSMRSFRVSTTEPVVAYQFNPLNNVGVYSNDASLLLPANAIGREYWVMAWPSGPDLPDIPSPIGAQTGWFTVLATAEGTTNVSITFAATLVNSPTTDTDLRDIRAGETIDFEMQQGEVLNFEAYTALFNIGDVSGSHVVADRPIIVFAGHEEAVIGEDSGDDSLCCADHLEEQLFPVNTWRTHIHAVHSPPRGTEDDYWRVLASENGTRITTSPAVSGLDGATLDAGEYVEVHTAQSFEIIATAPVLVGQFIVSQMDQGITSTRGDPAFTLSVPWEQYRSDYRFLTPTRYAEDWITVVRPAGVEVLLDGSPVSGFRSFGTGTWEVAYTTVADGGHNIVSDQPFGLYMYGYDSAVSYGLPGGLDLASSEEPTPP